ncbi:permease [Leptolyngbyaceae cyanobacterium CCMR0082]|uniref:Permease n=2 Tax=Adonisia turfae TaxID=2950184 RepID=A0A6M0S2X3_9CYAN|nr:Bax inhibitor-1 family protein [Adonisia turfae]MDV3349360.1 Bax inhibitor-1 family protein [Leptothoe sp. LEGE 181152]NEZ58269.1 permease [Adonisia turfae CCMR0081]NEZ62775.1 permease [Adonisia turfae CCMR0082]
MVMVAQARPSERAEFIKRTYTHLAGAVGAFVVVEFLFFQLGIARFLANVFLGGGRFGWLALLGGFALLGYLASNMAAKADDVNAQYTGLGLYVVGEAIIFAPLLYMAVAFSDPTVLPTAGIITLFLFGGLTAVAFTSGKDFAFLGGILKVGGMVALGLIVCSLLFGFSLGLFFSFFMVAFAAAAILYKTSNVMHRYSTNQHVAASLELFAAVMLLFWYVLRILMSSRR